MSGATYIFACVHNAGRSQMSAAFFNALADPAQACAESAGTDPGPFVHPAVVTVMLERGIDLTEQKPQKLTAKIAEGARALITMGCGEACPYVPGLRVLDWPLRDPKGLSLGDVRAIRDEIYERVTRLIEAEGITFRRDVAERSA